MKNKKKQLYIFLHVMKTGGTTLRYHIKENFEKRERLFLYRRFWPYIKESKDIEKHINSLTEKQKNELKVIFGHKSYYGIHKYFPDREVRYVTFIRNPIDRTISQYNFQRTNLKKRFNLKRTRKVVLLNGKVLPFGRKWFQKNKTFFSNHMLRFLFRHSFDNDKPLKKVNRNILNKIKKMLDKFYFIGITENSEDFLFVYYLLGVKKFFDNANVSRKNYARGDYEKIKKLILSNNKYDFELYNYAKKLNKRFKKQNKLFYPVVYYMKIKRLIFYNLGLYRRYELMRDQLYKQSAKLKKKSKIYSRFIKFIKGK